jgi:hypothetical protein
MRTNTPQDMKRYDEKTLDFLMPVRRHTEKFRDEKFGKPSVREILIVWSFIGSKDRCMWLPTAFDSRGRPFESACKRLRESWRKYRLDVSTDVVASIETGDENCWVNVTPEKLHFPKPRVRARRRR